MPTFKHHSAKNAPKKSNGAAVHILVTRPEPFGTQTAKILRQQGFIVTQVPLMEVDYHPLAYDADCLRSSNALVITSMQALYMPGIEHAHHLPLWAVGSPAKLHELGWHSTNVFPDVPTLVANMPTSLRWLYVRGERITQPLVLPHVLEHIAYTMHSITHWPIDIPWQGIDAVMFMSKETARTFMSLTQPQDVRHLTALCHSQAICDLVSSWPWHAMEVGSLTLPLV